MVVDKAQLSAKVQQCLFGYKEGHRLLASSLQLPNVAESMLLRLSDLAPGINEINNESYWTGIPLPSINQYALLHTWSAPEMPRPGCVWTHVLLIGFSDIARFVDLSVLTKFSVRPTLDSYSSKYAQPLLIDEMSSQFADGINVSLPSSDSMLKVIRSIYSSGKQHYLFAESNELDASVFRAWSQQWPRLRRSFSFRTAGSLSESLASNMHFDLRVLSRSDHYVSDEETQASLAPKPWESAAAKDALSLRPTEFRRFLWRYGSDICQGRERFNFLADLYISIHGDPSVTSSHEDILLRVEKILPDPEDGKVLKSDLVEGERNTYSLVSAIDPLENLKFFILHPRVKGLPRPDDNTLSYLRKLWPTRSEEILTLAEQAINSRSFLCQSILAQVARLIEPDSLFAANFAQQNLRHRLIEENPALLNSEKLLRVAQPELSSLLKLLPDDHELAKPIIGQLIYLDDKKISEEVFMRFPNIVARCVIDSLEKMSSGSSKVLPKVWLKAMTKSVAKFLRSGYIENAKSMSTLAVFAEVLGYRNRNVLNAGPLPWASALSRAKDDIDRKLQNKLYALLLMMALEKPLRGCEPIFERSFDTIHSALASEELAHDARSLVEESLPNLHWWKQWDMCHRLRLGVVRAYVNGKLDQESFHRLTKDKKLADSLVELAVANKKGRSYLGKRKDVVRLADKK